MLLSSQESDDAHVSRRYFFGKTHVAFADGLQPACVEDNHTLQAFNGAENREDFIESTADLVEETQLHLI